VSLLTGGMCVMEEHRASSLLCDRVGARHTEASVFSLGAPGEAGKCKELALYSLWVLEEVELFCLKKRRLGVGKPPLWDSI